MASLRKSPKSKYWIACYTDQDGKQRQRSTKEINRKKAMSIAEQYEHSYSILKTEGQIRKVLGDIHEELHGEKLKCNTTREFMQDWLSNKEVECARATYQKYQNVITLFLEYIGAKADQDLIYLTSGIIREFRDDNIENKTKRTAMNAIKIVRMALEDAWRDSLISENPAKKLKRLNSNDMTSKRSAFKIEEIKKVLKVANDEWRGIVLVGLYTGQRLGDIVRLTWNQIDLHEGEITFVTSKTDRTVILPIAKPLEDYLLTLNMGDSIDAPVFSNGYRIIMDQGRVGTLSNQFNKILASAGLVEISTHRKDPKKHGRSGKRNLNKLSFHSLRHTTTSMLKSAGVGEAVAMDFIGHDSRAISQQYTHIDMKSKKDALSKLPNII
jgi:integrase